MLYVFVIYIITKSNKGRHYLKYICSISEFTIFHKAMYNIPTSENISKLAIYRHNLVICNYSIKTKQIYTRD